MNTATVTPTNKGHRIWIQALHSRGYRGRYSVVFTDSTIVLTFHSEGARKVTDAKGGIVDLQSKRVTQWAQGVDYVNVQYTPNTITMTRGA